MLLWSQAIGMHDSHLRCVCELLGRVAENLTSTTLDHLCILVMDTPAHTISVVVVTLAGDLAQAQEKRLARQGAQTKHNSEMKVDVDNRCLNFLWKLSIEQSTTVSEAVAQQAITEIQNVLVLEEACHLRTHWANR